MRILKLIHHRQLRHCRSITAFRMVRSSLRLACTAVSTAVFVFGSPTIKTLAVHSSPLTETSNISRAVPKAEQKRRAQTTSPNPLFASTLNRIATFVVSSLISWLVLWSRAIESPEQWKETLSPGLGFHCGPPLKATPPPQQYKSICTIPAERTGQYSLAKASGRKNRDHKRCQTECHYWSRGPTGRGVRSDCEMWWQ